LTAAEELRNEIKDALIGPSVEEPNTIDHLAGAFNAAIAVAIVCGAVWLAKKLLRKKK
jgi:hypothetical protein